jgi:4'-phosphopantetheinyl transferase
LNDEAIHWLRLRAGELPLEDAWLTRSETATLAALRMAKRQRDWRLGRFTAKRAIALYLGLGDRALRRIEILAAEDGAPQATVDGETAPLSLSISHAGGIGLCTVAAPGVPLGCDVEIVEPRIDAWLADFFTDAERAVVAETPPRDQPRISTLLWSGKESALKALREGLRLDTRDVVVRLGEAEPCSSWRALSVCLTKGGVLRGWWRCADDHAMTVVVSRQSAPPLALAED